jgi:hypothetical protein
MPNRGLDVARGYFGAFSVEGPEICREKKYPANNDAISVLKGRKRRR